MGKAAATADIELIAIGNSKGIRLPKVLLRKYGWSDVWRSAGSIPETVAQLSELLADADGVDRLAD